MNSTFLTSLFNYTAEDCPVDVVFAGNTLASPASAPVRAKLDKLASDVGFSFWMLRGVMIDRMEVVNSFHGYDYHATVRAFGPHGWIGTFHIPDSDVWLESMRGTTFESAQQGQRERPFAFSRVLWWRVVDLPMIHVI